MNSIKFSFKDVVNFPIPGSFSVFNHCSNLILNSSDGRGPEKESGVLIL